MKSLAIIILIVGVLLAWGSISTLHAQVGCTSGTISVATCAAGMPVQSWQEVTMDSSENGTIRCPSSECTHSGNRLGFAIAGAWNYNTHQLYFNGADHDEAITHFIIFDAATNVWTDRCPYTSTGSQCTLDGNPALSLVSTINAKALATISWTGLATGTGTQRVNPNPSFSTTTCTNNSVVLDITETGGSTYGVTIVTGGDACSPGDTLVLKGSQVGGVDGINDLTITVLTVSGNSVGSGSLTGISPDNSNGYCTGTTWNIAWSGGAYTPTLVNPGKFCQLTQILTFNGSHFGGSNRTNDIALQVSANSANTYNIANHGYESTVADPITGEIMYMFAGTGFTAIDIKKRSLADAFWQATTTGPTTYQFNNSSMWWPGPLDYGDSGGTFMFYNSSGINGGNPPAGQLFFYSLRRDAYFNPVTGAANTSIDSIGGTSSDASEASYSRRKNIAVFGGGGANLRKMYKVDMHGVVTPLTDAPVDIAEQHYNLVEEPVTGNFLLYGAYNLYLLNPDGSGTYTLLNGSNTPPIRMLDPVTPQNDGMISAPIPEYGVVMYVGCQGDNFCRMFLYKYAGTASFTTRAADAGVLRAENFDTNTPFTHFDAPGGGTYAPIGIVPQNVTGSYAFASKDCTLSSDGGCSLKFSIPGLNTDSDYQSAYANFTNTYSNQIGGNSTAASGNGQFWMQIRVRMSPSYIANDQRTPAGAGSAPWASGEGWKVFGVGDGDPSNTVFKSSCTGIDWVSLNAFQRGFIQSEQSCFHFYASNEEMNAPVVGTTGMEAARPNPYCLFSQQSTNPWTFLPPAGNCWGWIANQWDTYWLHVILGPRGNGNSGGVGGCTPGSAPLDIFCNSWIQLFGARDGDVFMQPIWNHGPYNWFAGSVAGGDDEHLGKIWLLPYETNRGGASNNPDSQVNYDELILASEAPLPPLSSNVACSSPSKVVFTAQPSNALLGASLGTVTAQIEDSSNVPCTSATNPVTLSKNGSATWDPLATSSSLTKSASGGIVTWVGELSVTTTTGTGSIDANASGLAGATSNPITISAPAPHSGLFKLRPEWN